MANRLGAVQIDEDRGLAGGFGPRNRALRTFRDRKSTLPNQKQDPIGIANIPIGALFWLGGGRFT